MNEFKLCGQPIKDISLELTEKIHILFSLLNDEIESGKKIEATYKSETILLNDFQFDLDNCTLRSKDRNLYSYDTVDDEGRILIFNTPTNESECLLYFTFKIPETNPHRYYNADEFISTFETWYSNRPNLWEYPGMF